MRYRAFTFSTALLTMAMLLTYHAQAASIVNLAPQAQVIEIKVDGGWQEVTIPPGRVWSTIGPETVRYGDLETHIETTEEWAIWKDGTFGPQYNNLKARGNIFR